MNNDLKQKLISIRKMGFIESLRNGSSGVGYTFESLLGKQEDTLPYPDYNGIEIKAYRRSTNKTINLFSIRPDGDEPFPYERILKYAGYPDKDYPEYKVFHMDLSAKEKTKVNRITDAWLYVDRKNKKLSLYISKMGKMKPVNVSWSFSEINERISIKLQKLLLVEAAFNKYNGKEKFYYKNFRYLEIKKGDKFIDLLEEGTIYMSIKLSIYKNPENLGYIHDHGCSFVIDLKNIEKLYSLKVFL